VFLKDYILSQQRESQSEKNYYENFKTYITSLSVHLHSGMGLASFARLAMALSGGVQAYILSAAASGV
jgi:hypothetical protein